MSQYPPPYPAKPPDHPQAVTVLVLGICGLLVCQVIGPFAWSMGSRALREIDGSGGQVGGRDMVNIGRVLGMVSTALLGLALLFLLLLAVIAGLGVLTSSM